MDHPLNPIFSTRDTHGRHLRPGNRLIATSHETGWRSLYAALFQEAPFEATEGAIQHPFLIYHLSRPTEVTRRIEGARHERGLLGPRCICLTPGDTVTQWQHSGRPEILQVYLRQSVYSSALQEMYGVKSPSGILIPRFGIHDPLLEQLAMAIVAALRNGNAQDSLYVDTLAQMIAVHLARHHSTCSRPVGMPVPKIANWKIRRVIEFIEANLDGDLSLEAMAAQAEVSALYLPRAFKNAVGQSPHQYVIERRIERAKGLLRSTDLTVVDIALSSGFSSQSHLCNWFSRTVGVSPATYRQSRS